MNKNCSTCKHWERFRPWTQLGQVYITKPRDTVYGWCEPPGFSKIQTREDFHCAEYLGEQKSKCRS